MDPAKSKTLTAAYDIIGQIGEGATARVYHCRDKSNNQDVAIKVFYKRGLEPQDRKHLENEIINLKKLDHPNVVKIIKSLEDDMFAFLIMEYCSGGELIDRIIQKDSYSESDAQKILKNLADAIYFCHSHNIVHRDLKPENILLATPDEDARIVVADFGYSREQEEELLHSNVGTPFYVAPEVIKRTPYNAAVDIWSFGVISYLLLCGSLPFFAETVRDCLEKISRGVYEFHSPDWDRVSESAKDLVSKCLILDPAHRLTIDQVVKHPWFESPPVEAQNITPAIDQLRTMMQNKLKFKRAANKLAAVARLQKAAGLLTIH